MAGVLSVLQLHSSEEEQPATVGLRETTAMALKGSGIRATGAWCLGLGGESRRSVGVFATSPEPAQQPLTQIYEGRRLYVAYPAVHRGTVRGSL